MNSKLLLTLAASVLSSTAAFGQTYLLTTQTYSQDFNTLGATATSFAGLGANSGFSVAGGILTPNTGSSTGGAAYNYGVANDPDRAIGFLASGSYTGVFNFTLQNNTGVVISGFDLSYVTEQWRLGAATSSETGLSFSYAINGGTAVPVISLNSGVPISSGTTGALNGNLPANQLNRSGRETGITLNPGDTLVFTWADTDNTGADSGIAVDNLNVTFTAVPEPSAIALGVIGLAGMMALRRRRN